MSAVTGDADVTRFITNAGKREVVRRRIVRLVFVIYFLLIFEGALRKWGFPQLEHELFFIRVPVALLLYWIAFRYRRWPRLNVLMLIFYMFAIASIVLVPIQIIMGGYDLRYLLIAGYGWMNYFFYIPLAFIIGEQFGAEDMRRLIRTSMWLAVAATPIVILQFFSSPHSAINLGFGIGASDQFKDLAAALGHVRPTGFFTSTVGQTQFVASTTALLLAVFLQQKRLRNLSTVELWLGIASVAIMAMFGQSRGLFFSVALVFIAAGIAGMLVGKARIMIRVVIWPVVLIVSASILWPLLFPASFDVFVARWVAASAIESHSYHYGVFGRAFYGFYGFIKYLHDTPITGYLLGLGGNAARQIHWVQLPQAALHWHGQDTWAEDGWSRHIVELGPPLGLSFILFRIMLTIWLGVKAAQATHRSGNLLPVILFGYIGIVLLLGQVTGQSAINGFCWMYVGICLAAVRISRYGNKVLMENVVLARN